MTQYICYLLEHSHLCMHIFTELFQVYAFRSHFICLLVLHYFSFFLCFSLFIAFHSSHFIRIFNSFCSLRLEGTRNRNPAYRLILDKIPVTFCWHHCEHKGCLQVYCLSCHFRSMGDLSFFYVLKPRFYDTAYMFYLWFFDSMKRKLSIVMWEQLFRQLFKTVDLRWKLYVWTVLDHQTSAHISKNGFI